MKKNIQNEVQKINAEKEGIQEARRNLPKSLDRLPSVVKMKISNLQNTNLHAIYLQKTN